MTLTLTDLRTAAEKGVYNVRSACYRGGCACPEVVVPAGYFDIFISQRRNGVQRRRSQRVKDVNTRRDT